MENFGKRKYPRIEDMIMHNPFWEKKKKKKKKKKGGKSKSPAKKKR